MIMPATGPTSTSRRGRGIPGITLREGYRAFFPYPGGANRPRDPRREASGSAPKRYRWRACPQGSGAVQAAAGRASADDYATGYPELTRCNFKSWHA